MSLLRKLLDEVTLLIRQELALAGAELSRSMSKLLAGAGSIATGGAVLQDIEREIDDTRAELHRILYALEAKLSIRRR